MLFMKIPDRSRSADGELRRCASMCLAASSMQLRRAIRSAHTDALFPEAAAPSRPLDGEQQSFVSVSQLSTLE
jgi:hypothetical protein